MMFLASSTVERTAIITHNLFVSLKKLIINHTAATRAIYIMNGNTM
jgi:hypothetical protein